MLDAVMTRHAGVRVRVCGCIAQVWWVGTIWGLWFSAAYLCLLAREEPANPLSRLHSEAQVSALHRFRRGALLPPPVMGGGGGGGGGGRERQLLGSRAAFLEPM
jgi:hypothetical protein